MNRTEKAVLELFAMKMLGEQNAVSLDVAVLVAQGYDVDELAALISKYRRLPVETRNFSFVRERRPKDEGGFLLLERL